eukprot:13478-Heterococcus_DN1.PRE.2
MNSAHLDKSCSSGTSRETAFLTVRVSSFMLSVAAAVWPAPYCASARSVYQRAHRFSVAVKTQRPVVSPVACANDDVQSCPAHTDTANAVGSNRHSAQ